VARSIERTASRRPLRALVIDSDAATREIIGRHLDHAGFVVEECTNGRSALDRLAFEAFDLIALDAVLPGLDGLTLCRAARVSGPNVDAGIVLVTAKRSEADKVLGLTSGADDYVTKPFAARELMARVAALMRRVRRDVLRRAVDDTAALSLDVDRREACVRGRRVELTRQEFNVLQLLFERPGTVCSRAMLLERVWTGAERASERTVDVVISRLRRKIEADPRAPALILTSWGVGYKLADPSTAS